jgi:hypothetical protein
MFAPAMTIANGATAKAQFGPTNEAFHATVVDPMDRLFIGNNTQGVIQYVPGASGKSGAITSSPAAASSALIITRARRPASFHADTRCCEREHERMGAAVPESRRAI